MRRDPGDNALRRFAGYVTVSVWGIVLIGALVGQVRSEVILAAGGAMTIVVGALYANYAKRARNGNGGGS